MTSSVTPINVTIGPNVIDRSIVPYMHSFPMIVNSYNLRPYGYAQYWMDNVYVNQFVQPASIMTVNVGFAANTFDVQEGIYCPQTHAYAVVQETSQGTILQISENFSCINISTYGSANTFSATQYNANDIVYMANNTANVYANTMMGRVAFWDYANGALALTVDSGTLSNTVNNNVLFKVGSGILSNVTNIVAGNKFPVGAAVVSVANTSKYFLANNYQSNHGLITTANSGNLLQLAGNVNAGLIGQEIYTVKGWGIGQRALITGVDTVNNTVTLNTSWSYVYGNTYYGMGKVQVDGIGICTGIFHIPEDPNFNFQSGSRLITVNDSTVSPIDNTATMISSATLAASGALPAGSVTPVVPPTPQISAAAATTVAPSTPTSTAINNNGPTNNPQASADPLVQTFFTPKSTNPGTDYGCFATSVNLFFQNKPQGSSTQFPVNVYLVNTVNGFPTSNVLATSIVRYEDVNTTDGVNTFPDSANNLTYTKFSFVDPVYLAPGQEYGIVVYSESPDYQVWISQLGETIVNSNRLISSSPYVGSFFKSQNASAWTPIQNQQLMFVLNKAVFSTSPVNLTFAVQAPPQNTYVDMLSLHSADLTFPVANIQYGIKTVTANSGVQDTNFKPVNIDVPFNYGGDLINSSIGSDRRRVIQAGNANTCLVQATLSTTNPDVSPFFHSEALNLLSITNVINNGDISPEEISITSGGNHINVSNVVVTFSAPDISTGTTATANVTLTGNVVSSINIINPGSGYLKNPTITISEAGAPANATAIVTGETSASGGNGLVRYVTRSITLADGFDSGDLNVFLQAIRPQGTDIAVYYKVLSSADPDPITSKNWQLMEKVNDIYSPDQATPISLSYNTGTNALGIPRGSVSYVENGITYPIGGKFKTFSIKIVLIANDPTVPPEVQNMRAIAVPAG